MREYTERNRLKNFNRRPFPKEGDDGCKGKRLDVVFKYGEEMR